MVGFSQDCCSIQLSFWLSRAVFDPNPVCSHHGQVPMQFSECGWADSCVKGPTDASAVSPAVGPETAGCCEGRQAVHPRRQRLRRRPPRRRPVFQLTHGWEFGTAPALFSHPCRTASSPIVYACLLTATSTQLTRAFGNNGTRFPPCRLQLQWEREEVAWTLQSSDLKHVKRLRVEPGACRRRRNSCGRLRRGIRSAAAACRCQSFTPNCTPTDQSDACGFWLQR